ncbi:MAG: BlaI/MecI/CopY family transcriptional regulator [Rhodopirellula sp.]|nr:BlaI/MecI/CopY family transcriptional regulator [Rhodopirellula sp.]
MKSEKYQPAEFELQVLGVLWEHGPSTVREVMGRLPDGKPRAYTSVLSVMQVMQKKGLLSAKRQKDGPANIYSPRKTREQIAGPMMKSLVSRVFGGDPALAVQQLLSGSNAATEDVNAIRQFLDEFEGTLPKSKSRRKS